MTKKHVYLILLLVFATGTVYLAFYNTGFAKYMHLRKEVDSLNIVIKNLEIENRALQGNYDSLSGKIPYKIEKIAREKYNMKKQNETVISVEEK